MARCPKCGKEVTNETQKFCDSCGTPLQENTVNETPVTPVEPTGTPAAPATSGFDFNAILEKVKALDKKVLGIGAAAVVLVIAIVILGATLLGGGGYMNPVNNYMKAVNERNTDFMVVSTALNGDKVSKLQQKVTNAYIDAEAEIYDDYTYEDALEDQADSLEDFYDDADDEYEDWKLSFEEKDAEKVDKDEREELTESMNDYYGDLVEEYEDMLDDDDEIEEFADMYNIDEEDAVKIIKAQIEYYKFFANNKVQDAYEVKGKFIIESEDDTLETDTVKFTVIKVNGSWIYLYCEDYVEFEDDDYYLFYDITSDLNYGSLSIF